MARLYPPRFISDCAIYAALARKYRKRSPPSRVSMSEELTQDELDQLRLIADAGGVLAGQWEWAYEKAERLGLVWREFEGGGWGYTQTVILTNPGRRMFGLPVITPNFRQPSLFDRLRTAITGWAR